MRGQDHVRQALQAGDERVARGLRFVGEDVDGGAGEVAAQQMAAQRLVVHHDASTQVEEQAARPHLAELVLAEQAGVPGATVDVEGDRLGNLEQLVQAGTAPGVAEGQLVGHVVEVDPHAQRLGDHGQLAADVAVADDAEGPAADLVRALGRLVPDPGMHGGVLVGQVPGHGDDLGDHQLDHTAGVGERSVEHHGPALGGRGQVDLVGADAEGADGQQVRGRVQDPPRHCGLGADAEHRHPTERIDQLRLVQRSLGGLDGNAALDEQADAFGMDVLQQQSFHARQCRKPDQRPGRFLRAASSAPTRHSTASCLDHWRNTQRRSTRRRTRPPRPPAAD